MDNTKLRIPDIELENFIFFMNLPELVRNELIQALENAPIGLHDSTLFEYLSSNVKNLSGEKISSLLSIYQGLSKAKDELELDDNEFIQDLKLAFIDTGNKDLTPNKESLKIFESLFNSKTNINTSRKILNEYAENLNNYISSKIITDIRPIFDDENFIGSAIVNELKINYNSQNEEQQIFISVDENDIDDLIEVLRTTKSQIKAIREKFKNLDIIKIQR